MCCVIVVHSDYRVTDSVRVFFFLNDPPTTEISPLPLHDPLPISSACHTIGRQPYSTRCSARDSFLLAILTFGERSEEHTSELQSQSNLVCRLLLEKKKKDPSLPLQHQLTSRPCSSSQSLLRSARP